MKVDAEIKKLYTKDGAHVGYILIKLTFDGKNIPIENSPFFKNQVDANNFIRGLQEKINNDKSKFKSNVDRLKDRLSIFDDLFGGIK